MTIPEKCSCGRTLTIENTATLYDTLLCLDCAARSAWRAYLAKEPDEHALEDAKEILHWWVAARRVGHVLRV